MRRISDSERNLEASVEAVEQGITTGSLFPCSTYPLQLHLDTCTGNDSPQIETSEDHLNFFDGSGTLFNMYTKLTEQDDNKMVHRLQTDADRTLIFVSIYIGLHTASQFPIRTL
jgi:hypothetical protein